MEDDAQQIGYLVIAEAMRRFEEIGMGYEFGVQGIGECVVFGGTPRVIWHPVTGFILDKPYCSQDFIEKWEAAYGK